MTKVSFHLCSLVCAENPTLQSLLGFARRQTEGRYVFTDDRRAADVVLFVENGYVGLQQIPAALKIRAENPRAILAMFSECDWPFAFLPGLYSSLVKPLPWAWSWAYFLDETPTAEPDAGDRPYLFSFLGRVSTHPVRRALQRLDSPPTPCLDTSDAPRRFDNWHYQRTFDEVMRRSRFVLCPRGFGASSKRTFEAMRAGRVPVIISDAWIEPPVGDWSRFSIRVRERDIEHIPQLCADHAESAGHMGTLAREAFQQHFAPKGFLETALDFVCANARESRAARQRLLRPALKALSVREFRTVASQLRHAIAVR